MTYVISDLHGYHPDKLKALLDKAGFSSADTCYVLGDVIDRGSYGVELLLWIMEQPNIKFLLGNHEDMLLACDFLFLPVTDENMEQITDIRMGSFQSWMENGGETTVVGLRRQTPETRLKIVDFLRNAPLYAEVSVGGKDYVLVHGGLGYFEEDKPLDEYFPRDLLWCRPYINTRYYKNKTTVFGHTPTKLYGYMYSGKPIKTDTWINIDVGVASGLSPLLLRLDDMCEFYGDSPF